MFLLNNNILLLIFHFMNRFLLWFSFLLWGANMFSQDLDVIETFPLTPAGQQGILVCGSAGTFQLTVNNISGVALSNILLTVQLDPGNEYVTSSVSGAGVSENSASPSSPIFQLPNLGIGASAVFTLQIEAKCAAIGTSSNLAYAATYTGSTIDPISASNVYQVEYAALTVNWLTNQNFTGAPNQVYTRSFQVTNGGFGRVGSFSIVETLPSCMILQSASPTPTQVGTQVTYTFAASDFNTVGNNDNFLDNGESITVTETIQLTGCGFCTANYNLTWGCNSTTCETVSTSAGADVQVLNPNLVVTTRSSVPTRFCLGTSYTAVSYTHLTLPTT